MASNEITFFERLSIQMELVVPIIRRLQDVLGEEVIINALEESNRKLAEQNRSAFPKGSRGDCLSIERGLERFAKDALEYEMLFLDKDRADFNVASCRYTKMMQNLNAEDLGALVICDADFAMAEKQGLELKRTQTCMKGASHCDFRYRARAAEK